MKKRKLLGGEGSVRSKHCEHQMSFQVSKNYVQGMTKEANDRIDVENQRLYNRITKISRSPQFGYMGLQNSHRSKFDKALEAGFLIREDSSLLDLSKTQTCS